MKRSVMIIAEAGVNHNGCVDRALEMVDAAASAGANVVKFQCFRTSNLVTRGAKKAPYQSRRTGDAGGQWEMLRALELSVAQLRRVRSHAEARGIEFLATPFCVTTLREVVKLGVRRVKLGSGELTDGPLLRATGECCLPVVVSTGMACMGEVEEALGMIAAGAVGARVPRRSELLGYLGTREGRAVIQERVTLMHCSTAYPALPADVNLMAMENLGRAFGLPVGYSDHTAGCAISVAAVARGATVIEKHFTLDKALPGPDHAASLDVGEFGTLVGMVRQVETAMGDGIKLPSAEEEMNKLAARKVLVALQEVKKGTLFNPSNLGCRRAGSGVSAMHYWDVLGSASPRDLRVGEAVTR